MARDHPRKRPDDLHKALVENKEGPLLGLHEVNPQDLAPFHVKIFSFDLEASEDELPSVGPPHLFAPLAQGTLDKHPIDPKQYEDDDEAKVQLSFPECPSPSDEYAYRLFLASRVLYTSRFLIGWATEFPRHGFPRSGEGVSYAIFSLQGAVGWVDVEDPNTLYVAAKHWDVAPAIPFGHQWHTEGLYEWYKRENDVPLYPHLIRVDSHRGTGRDGSMLPADLVALIITMRARAFQVRVSEDVEEDFCGHPDRYPGRHKPAFEGERKKKCSPCYTSRLWSPSMGGFSARIWRGRL